jgi:hypothetical protein
VSFGIASFDSRRSSGGMTPCIHDACHIGVTRSAARKRCGERAGPCAEKSEDATSRIEKVPLV